MSGSAIEPFDVRAYYQRITSQDIGEVSREILGSYIKDEQGSTIFVDCPRHKSESHRSFHIWTDKQGWYCHGCGKGGDILQLVEFIQSGEITTGKIGVMPVTHRNARDFLAARIGLSPKSVSSPKRCISKRLNDLICCYHIDYQMFYPVYCYQ